MDATQDKRLFLIDAYAMIFRGYYALIRSPRITSGGVDTSAIFGFTNSLIELIRRERPTHLAVVFDVGQASVRNNDFTDIQDLNNLEAKRIAGKGGISETANVRRPAHTGNTAKTDLRGVCTHV